MLLFFIHLHSGGLSSTQAYAVLVGHVRLMKKFEWPSRLGWEHLFLQYRGFTRDYSVVGVFEQDINSDSYRYKTNTSRTRLSREGVAIVGHSYCTYGETHLFSIMWDQLRFRLALRDCRDFVKALTTFLTTGVCTVPTKK